MSERLQRQLAGSLHMTAPPTDIGDLVPITDIIRMVDRVSDDLLDHAATGTIALDAHNKLTEAYMALGNIIMAVAPPEIIEPHRKETT